MNSQRGTHHRLVVEVVLEGLLAGGEGLRDLVAGVVVRRRGELGRELGLERALHLDHHLRTSVAPRGVLGRLQRDGRLGEVAD